MSSVLETFGRDFGGDIIEPDAAEYESARRTVLASGSPASVFLPETVADVQAAVMFAAEADLPLSVRGGGHAFAGFGTNDGGVVIDLARLAQVDVIDRQRHTVRIGGGATWGGVADHLAPLGLAISSGDTAGVGVGGLTLSGGIGWKVRRYGLALDSLTAADVVTAGGELVRASAEENPDLFWAIRGGGGNFGIVVAFEFTAHRTTDVFSGSIAFAASEAARVLHGWAEYLRTAPEELTSTAELANPFAGGPDAPVVIHVVFDGDDPERAAAALEPIRRLGRVIADDVALKPYARTLVEGATPPPGFQLVTRSAFVDPESVDEALRTLVGIASAAGSPFIGVRSLGGAVSRVPADATAYAHRRAELLVITTIAGPTPVVEAARGALDAAWLRLRPLVVGAYGNFLSSATEEDVAAIYPPATHRRLTAVKRRYDPADLFAGNHNIRPASL